MATFPHSIVVGGVSLWERVNCGAAKGRQLVSLLFSLVLQQRLVEVTRSQRVITFLHRVKVAQIAIGTTVWMTFSFYFIFFKKNIQSSFLLSRANSNKCGGKDKEYGNLYAR